MSTHYLCNPSIELIEMDQEWIVMDTEGFTITKINPAGAYILEALMDQRTLDEIVEMIEVNFAVDSNLAKAETTAFIQQLQQIGIVYERSVQY